MSPSDAVDLESPMDRILLGYQQHKTLPSLVFETFFMKNFSHRRNFTPSLNFESQKLIK